VVFLVCLFARFACLDDYHLNAVSFLGTTPLTAHLRAFTAGKLRVAVSSTPGKTKHFQTLILSDSVVLCDCPGLVFPSFMRNIGEMLCAGMLPINQMRDYHEPASVIASRIPQYLLEAALGIKIYRHLDPLDAKDRPPTPTEMLSSYCDSRGYITNGTGRWDEFRACKDMLSWFTDGKLLHVALPPFQNLEAAIQQRWIKETERIMARRHRVAERVSSQHSAAAAAALALKLTLEDNKRIGDDSASSVFVFGDASAAGGGEYQVDAAAPRVDANGYEFIDDDSSDDGGEDESGTNATGDASTRREHKRLKTWGKKNRKLRNKDPYGEEMGVNSLVAYSTNRVQNRGNPTPVALGGASVASGSHSGGRGGSSSSTGGSDKLMRHSTQHPYGTPFVRAVLPHHQQDGGPQKATKTVTKPPAVHA
jgi:hypothetical protein